MDFRTIVDIKKPDFNIDACENILLVGSCFADNIGKKFEEEKFNVTVNPFGVMYNPASIYHTIMKTDSKPRIAIFTLGTNHVYILKETGEIVDNCAKKPQCLFVEKELTIDECAEYITKAINALLKRTNIIPKTTAERGLLTYKEITLLPETFSVQIEDKIQKLTPIEFDIFNLLFQNHGNMVSAQKLLKEVWGYEPDDNVETIRVHIRHLRTKINKISGDKNYIETIYGGGYKLNI